MNIEQIRQWRNDAIIDGWEHSETEEYVTKLNRDGWGAMTILRLPKRRGFNRHSINVWAPDGLVIKVPETYCWEVLQERLRLCSRCGVLGETVRLGFAGRVCPDCREKHKAEVEYPGWTN